MQTIPQASDANREPDTENKMTNAAPLRQQEFPQAPRSEQGRGHHPDLAANPQRMDSEAVTAGGEIGEIDGDKQRVGEVGSIMDQNEATPDFPQQR